MADQPLSLFEYAVIMQPKLNKDGEVVSEGRVIVPVTTVLVKDQAQAELKAARDIPDEEIKNLDRIMVVVRPF